jgi:hypothetical protein
MGFAAPATQHSILRVTAPRLPAWPPGQPVSDLYRVRVQGIEVPCFATDSGHFAWAAIDGACAVEIHVPVTMPRPAVRPLSRGIHAEVDGTTARFQVPGPGHLVVENDGGQHPRTPPLFLFLEPLSAFDPPRGNARVLAAGRIHEMETLSIAENETVWLEPGAVVEAPVRITRANGARLCGCGWIRGRPHLAAQGRNRLLLAQASDGITLDGPLFTHPPAWTIVLGACDDATVRNVKTLTNHGGQDGIDVCGSRRTRISGCLLRNGDDCIVVKAFDSRPHMPEAILSFERDVDDVLAEGCVLYNTAGGNGLEIGHELRVDSVRNIVFRDIDIVAVHDFGAPFSIHAYDRAAVEDVVFEHIRVDHHYDMLFDIRISRSRYSQDAQRGHVRSVAFRDIDIHMTPYNAGYTKSVIGGWGPSNRVEDVVFERLRIDGRTVTDLEELELYTRHAHGVVLRP